jgi:hypothetical protein
MCFLKNKLFIPLPFSSTLSELETLKGLASAGLITLRINVTRVRDSSENPF